MRNPLRQPNRQIEHDNQVTVIEWAKYNEGRFPELKLLYAIPNAGAWRGKPFITKSGLKLPPLQATKFKKEGLKSGVPDLCLPVPRGGYHSLYIEMKSEDGKMSENQEKFAAMLCGQGNLVMVCRNADAAIKALETYLKSGV